MQDQAVSTIRLCLSDDITNQVMNITTCKKMWDKLENVHVEVVVQLAVSEAEVFFYPTTSSCHRILCTADIIGQCPNVLRAPGGCNNPCTVFQTNQYCCTNGQGSCSDTEYSRFFKQRCPDAYSYPQDDPPSTFTCTNTNYRVVFCPRIRLDTTGSIYILRDSSL
ncbi:hypothetical protein EUTSA_v10029289mg, partial [Eutrema salsugineum]